MFHRIGLVVVAGFLIGFRILPSGALAQRKGAPVNASSAPVPAPILQGKKAFISFELGDVSAFPSVYSGGPERAYNEFYQGMRQWGRYELVSDPEDADVIFAVRFVESPGSFPQIRLGIMSGGGRVSLWGFTEEIDTAFHKKNRDAAFTDTILQVINDVKLLVSPNGPPVQQP
jgi:hypothetical protein